MASELRRAAKALVGSRGAQFASRYGIDDSVARLRSAVAQPEARGAFARGLSGSVSEERVVLHDRSAGGRPSRATFTGSWRLREGAAHLEGEFVPARSTQRWLASLSAALSAAVLASAAAIAWPGESGALAFLVPLFTGFAILAFPFVVAAAASRREAEEARIERALAKLLRDGEG